MRYLLTLLLLIGTAPQSGCYLEDRGHAVGPGVTWPDYQTRVCNPGAILQIILMSQDELNRRLPGLSGPTWTVTGYAPVGHMEVWVKVDDTVGWQLTPLEAGVIAHELSHKVDELGVTPWRILRLCSTDAFALDCHGYGLIPETTGE